ncbi:ABC transporter substrate-binding protein [Arthrobacter sp. AQ5-05]|uniref:ABC transporter substrate-binding protein n=1 Tax=Arthrobacter sp. AQ5-05 TaxID=2184581 RepID=UPI00256FFD7C|nr:ABC transporter substrate-binding protein [Arthrobacter sp. AQ5-05]
MKISQNFRKNFGKGIVTAAALGLTLGMAGCGSGANGADGLQKVTMMTDVAFLPKHAPFFSAAKQGFFKDEGIDLEILPGSGSNNTVVAVNTGKIDFGWADFGVTVLNQGKGAEVKQINLVQAKDAYATVALADSGIKTWDDLKGKTVATEGAGAMTSMWPLALEKLGFAESDIEVVHAAGEAKIPGLLAGQWDANLALFVSDGPVLVGLDKEPVILKWADLGFELYGNGIIASDKMIAKDPELVKKFNRAMSKGFMWACQNQDQAAADIMEEVNGLKESAVKNALDGQCSLLWNDESEKAGFGTMSDAGVKNAIDTAATYLGLENADALSPQDVYTNEFIEPIEKDTKIELPSKQS